MSRQTVAEVGVDATQGEVHLGELPGRAVNSWPYTEMSLRLPPWAFTNSADCTNMPPEPHAGSNTRPWYGSSISTSSLDDRARRVERARVLAGFLARELAKEVLINAAENVV